jgi:hypothetical protein
MTFLSGFTSKQVLGFGVVNTEFGTKTEADFLADE